MERNSLPIGLTITSICPFAHEIAFIAFGNTRYELDDIAVSTLDEFFVCEYFLPPRFFKILTFGLVFCLGAVQSLDRD